MSLQELEMERQRAEGLSMALETTRRQRDEAIAELQHVKSENVKPAPEAKEHASFSEDRNTSSEPQPLSSSSPVTEQGWLFSLEGDRGCVQSWTRHTAHDPIGFSEAVLSVVFACN